MQLFSINPGGTDEEMRRIRNATTEIYLAHQDGTASKLRGKGLGQKYAAIAAVRRGPDMFAWESIQGSKLRALSTTPGMGSTVITEDITQSDPEEKEGS